MAHRFVAGVLALVWISANIAGAAPANGASGLLEGLPKLKEFKAGRQSSCDPSGGNNDGRQDWPIQPKETRQMAKIDGAGAITHIWVTIASDDKQHLKNLVLRMYWDGEETPSVEAPIGDFFGLGYSQYYQYACLPIQIGTNNGLNCFWRMPFHKSALVTVTNDGPVPCNAFYYYVDYQQYENLPDDVGLFHAQYRQEYPCTSTQNYVFLEAQGRGQYVGVNLSIHNRADGWWGEGDDMFYIDGEEKPSLSGTGSEDYFCGAWGYGPAFSDLFLGCPLRGENARNAFWNVYRYHLTDPIPFTKSIRVTIEHGHANDRSDDFSSVAYWYQTEPHAPFPALAPVENRMPGPAPEPTPEPAPTPAPFVEQGASEVEDFVAAFNNPEVSVQPLANVDATAWSGGKQLFLQAKEPKAYPATLPQVAAADSGVFKAELWITTAPDYGTCELWVNNQKVAEWDGYAPAISRTKIEFPVTVNEGGNLMEVRVTGKRAEATGFLVGVDCFRLTKQQ